MPEASRELEIAVMTADRAMNVEQEQWPSNEVAGMVAERMQF